MNKFKFSQRSENNFKGVHPDLVAVVKLALSFTTQDFTVTQGVRTLEEQRKLLQEKKTQTLNSKHLPQADGYGHAIDIVPYPVNWTLEKFYPIAEAFRKAAKTLNVKIRWGGSWHILNDTDQPIAVLIEQYAQSKRKVKQKAFIDAPHFELVK